MKRKKQFINLLLIVGLLFATVIACDNSDVLDADGNVYKTVKIGSQIWMAENLAYLPAVHPPTSGSYTEPRYYVYGYTGSDVVAAKQQANYTTYGVLYNWPAANAACPPGWHLPSDDEWKQLEKELGMTQAQADAIGWRGTDQGTQMKTISGWWHNENGTNTSGFSGLPGGECDGDGSFDMMDLNGSWWSSTEHFTYGAWYRSLSYNYAGFTRNDHDKEYGISVRCIRD